MFSVTERIEKITQPHGGYLPKELLRMYQYEDGQKILTDIPEYSTYSAIQATVVDYMTRFLCGYSVEEAFYISLLGAQNVEQEDTARRLLESIKGRDQKSIISACKLVGYDVAYRRGPEYYPGVDHINPPNSILSNISIMIDRGLTFLDNKGPIVKTGFTFEGGYSQLISSGDGDFLTKTGLWDFKVSLHHPTSKETLQILIYYLLGINSIHPEFKNLTRIGLFNPLKNQAYEIYLDEIPDEVFHDVCRYVIGYKISEDVQKWREVSGNDEDVVRGAVGNILTAVIDTGFDPSKYEDGIHNITVSDYWSYFRDKSERPFWNMPKFNRTDHIKFLKHDGFVMFVSVSPKGSNSILNGGFLRSLDKPIKYYYDNLPAYGNAVLNTFAKYWNAIFSIGEYVKLFNGQNQARVHGCIVDIDYFNHIYLNPNGSITPYFARSMYSRIEYKNLSELLTEHAPYMLSSYNSHISAAPNTLVSSSHQGELISISDPTLRSVLSYNTSIYDISNRLKILQLVHDYHLIAIWHDSFLPAKEMLVENSLVEKAIKNITENYDEYLELDIFEVDKKKKKIEEISWNIIKRVTLEELFAIVHITIRDNADLLKNFDSITFSVSQFYNSFRYVSVLCSPSEIPAIFPLLIKPQVYFQTEIAIRIIPNPEVPEVTVDFMGGKRDILPFKGEYRYESNSRKIVPDKKT